MESANGKLMVYASGLVFREKRFNSVSVAAKRMAELLKLSFEVVPFREKTMPIYVFYKSEDGEPIPLYCSKDKKASIEEVYTSLKNMIFVLSFHPRHSALMQIRKEVMQFS